LSVTAFATYNSATNATSVDLIALPIYEGISIGG
jgi:hypothetical protein